MTLGDVMQASTAFVTVQQSFNWLVENYPEACRLDSLRQPGRRA